MRHKQNPGWGS